MLEWLKRHAWKACIRQKRIGGSNPPYSAEAVATLSQRLFLLGQFAVKPGNSRPGGRNKALNIVEI